MVMIRTIQVRMTRDQYAAIQNLSRLRGFNSLSAYMRHVALDQDPILEKKIYEIHAHIVGTMAPTHFKKQLSSRLAPSSQ